MFLAINREDIAFSSKSAKIYKVFESLFAFAVFYVGKIEVIVT